jgi:uncharacterized protein YqgC (DUF456 family)
MGGLFVTTLLIMLIGLVGCVVPAIPGLPIVWLGALFYAWQTSFQALGWPMLALLFILMAIGTTSGIWMGALGARQGGASLWSSALGLLLGVVGLLVFSLPGMIIGSLLGVMVGELVRHGDWRRMLQASRSYLVSWALSIVVEGGIGVLMIILFVARIALQRSLGV